MSDYTPPNTRLLAYLKKGSPKYHGKVFEVGEVIQGWLSYVTETFPHYTRHTIEHSEQIVQQISNLLFKDDAPEPVIRLSAVEAYILIASAYFHDAGMVASNAEKEQILKSNAWNTWIQGNGGGAKRWREIQNFREGQSPPDNAVRHFLADTATRHLIAEYIRREHHSRAATVIERHQASLGRFAFDDPKLQRTISDVCIAHGLRHHDLEDRQRYPDERDIRNEKVNVRFMAILLRLGDLLDMDSNRACPLLLNAACPVPADSLAHWTQYQRITHRTTTPERIEIHAECKTQDEHRVLQDWCQWLVDETQHAYTLMARSKRHSGWKPPFAKFGENSIVIQPANDANYIFSTWRFQLDQDIIFERLIKDVYDHPSTFIRELIQNALDAMRCQMYADLIKDGLEPPEYPTEVDEGRRKRYPIHVGLRMEKPRGESEEHQIFSIEDHGIGMDRDVIERYLLQIGRSFYTTDEFRRSFHFVPTSRFGIGFLSVFAISDKVTVETCKTNSPSNDGPLKLTLTGPRNYLLTERGERKSNGTKIEVFLRNPMEHRKLTELITDWCKRVEFPIEVDDLGDKKTILSEHMNDFIRELPDPSEEGAKFVIRAFPINRQGLEGELYVLARVGATGESWALKARHEDVDPEREVWEAERPRCPTDLVCLHGIGPRPRTQMPGWEGLHSMRLDYRGSIDRLTLSRSSTIVDSIEDWPEIMSRWEEILTAHLATTPLARSPGGWKYKQRLIGTFGYKVRLRAFWASQPETIRVYLDGNPRLESLNALKSRAITTVTPPPTPRETTGRTALVPAWDNSLPTLVDDDIAFLSNEHDEGLFWQRAPCNARQLKTSHVAIDWEIATERKHASLSHAFNGVIPLPWSGIGFGIHPRNKRKILLNSSHLFVQWLKRIGTACEQQQNGLKPGQEWRLFSLVRETIQSDGSDIGDLDRHIDVWRSHPNLPPDLLPPEITFKPEMFSFWPDKKPS